VHKQQLVSQLAAGTRTYFDLSYVAGARPGHSPDSIQTLDLYVPPGPGPFPLIVWIHGGGWHSGDKEIGGADLALQFGPPGFAVASLNYRLTADVPFPAQIEDCKAALAWLRGHAVEYGLDAGRVGVVGHSAGAHLAALMAFTESGSAFGKAPSAAPCIKAAVLWACPSDLRRNSGGWPPKSFVWNPNDTFSKTFFPAGAYDEELAANASPIRYVHPGIPPVLIVHGAKDVMVPPAQADALAKALKHAGIQATLRIDPHHGHDVMRSESYQEAKAFFQRFLMGSQAR